VGVTLNGKDRNEAKNKIQFAYYDPHALKSLLPGSGPTVGGTALDVNGEGFKQVGVCDLRCRFGTHDVEATASKDNKLACTSPSVEVPGDALFQVSLNGQQYSGRQRRDQLSFQYFENPLITNFEPKTGPSSGNSTVVIYGAGFIGQNETAETTDIWVRFNNTSTGDLYGVVKADRVGINEIQL
jgi:hypothetical protein